MIKTILINTEKIEITFDTENEAQNLYSWMEKILFAEKVIVEGNVLTYDISSHKYKFYPIKRLLRKLVYDNDEWEDELYSSAFSTDKVNYRLNCWVKGDKLLRVTPVNSDGTLGTLDFAPYEYIKSFSLIQLNKTYDIYFLSQRGHVGDNPMHEIKLSEDTGVRIEVGNFYL